MSMPQTTPRLGPGKARGVGSGQCEPPGGWGCAAMIVAVARAARVLGRSPVGGRSAYPYAKARGN